VLCSPFVDFTFLKSKLYQYLFAAILSAPAVSLIPGIVIMADDDRAGNVINSKDGHLVAGHCPVSIADQLCFGVSIEQPSLRIENSDTNILRCTFPLFFYNDICILLDRTARLKLNYSNRNV